jgi:hypothetical protein
MNFLNILKDIKFYKFRVILLLTFEFLLIFFIFLLTYILVTPPVAVSYDSIKEKAIFTEDDETCYFTVNDIKPLVYEDGTAGYTVFFTGPHTSLNVDLVKLPCEVGTRYRGTESALEIKYKDTAYTKTIPSFYYVQPDIDAEVQAFQSSTYDLIYADEYENATLLYSYKLYIFAAIDFFVVLTGCFIAFKIKLTRYARKISLQKMKGVTKSE